MTVYGNTGKLLRINLSSSRTSVEELDSKTLSTYLGGKCLGSRILYDEVPPKTNPLGEENRLIFVTGPLQGTTVPGSGRFAVVFKSPLTGGFGEAQGGGTFGPFMKMAGYDAIVVQGASANPVFVDVSNGVAAIEDASRLWGRDVWETEKALKRGRKGLSSIVSIGPAGERLVRFSAMMNDLGRAAARGGPGAVMGSKRLKAITLEGSSKMPLAQDAEFSAAVKKATEEDQSPSSHGESEIERYSKPRRASERPRYSPH
jgi:aldehyde:ferredoxin oxidoreductase